MTGFKPVGLFEKKEGQGNFIVVGNDRTQTNAIMWEKRGGSEILEWLKMTGLKPIGLLKNERGVIKFYSGWKWQDSNQWDY